MIVMLEVVDGWVPWITLDHPVFRDLLRWKGYCCADGGLPKLAFGDGPRLRFNRIFQTAPAVDDNALALALVLY